MWYFISALVAGACLATSLPGKPPTPTGSSYPGLGRSCADGYNSTLSWWTPGAGPRTSVSGVVAPAKTDYISSSASGGPSWAAGNLTQGLFSSHGAISAIPSAPTEKGSDYLSQGLGSPVNEYLHLMVGLLVALLLC
ncbi:hypothetical protein EMCG_01053 [[Emmonsia] crescens]|uniref:Uncharacterized protein n=1 Tax=[Emmonsia] crescens TaxID=73230 RepID=A0A0G2ICA3_9EURO|nr:hypothetical protein EMCG_01053 [Emmonsia crescens UAMH 3008]